MADGLLSYIPFQVHGADMSDDLTGHRPAGADCAAKVTILAPDRVTLVTLATSGENM